MFKNRVSKTKFTTEEADSFFENITGDAYRGDVTFLSTMRALLGKRANGAHIKLRMRTTTYTSGQIESVSDSTVMNAVVSNAWLFNDSVTVLGISGDSDANDKIFGIFREHFTSTHAGFYRSEKVTLFYKKFLVDCYVNEGQRSVVFLVENMDIRKMHALQVSILAVMPWYFDPKNGISADELSLIRSLREDSADQYLDCLDKLAELYDFRTATIKKLLGGFETRFEKQERSRVVSMIESSNRDVEDLNRRIGNILRERNELQIKLLGLEQRIASGATDSDMMDYFLCNRNLVIERVDDSFMSFSVKGYLEYFDRDMAERVIYNPNSYVYTVTDASDAVKHKVMDVMQELFLNDRPRMKIHFCAGYNFDLNGNVEPQSHREFDETFRGCIPNPHINNYSCMGNYSRTINNLLKDRNYIGAVEQCVASCKSLNFADNIVMCDFMRLMYDFESGKRFIDLDGRYLTVLEAAKWLEEQETNSEETEEAKDE